MESTPGKKASFGCQVAFVSFLLMRSLSFVARDPIDDDRSPGSRPPDPSTTSRRPADVWVPRGPSGGQEPSALASIFASARTRSSILPPSALAFLFVLLWLRRSASHAPFTGKTRDLQAGTRTSWLSMSVPRHVSLGRVRTVVICWFGVFFVSLLDQETDHGDTRISYF